jgi:hypothetical protein
MPWGKSKPSLFYDSPKDKRGEKGAVGKGGHGQTVSTYGGSLTENIVQAISRDVLAEAMLRCESAGLSVVGHLHDEMLCEVPATDADQALEKMLILMSTNPTWADGFPILVEGFVSTRFAKAPIPYSPKRSALGGKLL